MNQFSGIYPALITPFTADDTIDRAAVRRVVEHNLKLGVQGFYVAGSTGEVLLMSKEERKELLEATVEAVNGRAQVLAHIGCFYTADSIDLARHAQQCGVAAVSSLPPFYYKFTMEELTRYYLEVAEAADVPMIVYNAPAMSGVSFNCENIAPIFASPRVGGVKFTSYDLYQMQRLINRYPDKVVINGHDEIFLSGLAAGSRCAIGSTFNFMAGVFVKIRELFMQNRMDEAASWQNRANAVIDALIEVGVFRGVKGMLNVLGLDCGACRKPFLPLTREETAKLEKALLAVMG